MKYITGLIAAAIFVYVGVSERLALPQSNLRVINCPNSADTTLIHKNCNYEK